MKSLVLIEPHKLNIQERPVLVPGPREVLIRVKSASICHTDFVTINGEYPDCKYPTVLGHEFSGIVEECGKAVTHVKKGDRVACLGYSYCGNCSFCLRGLHNGCKYILAIPFHIDGAYQEFVCVPDVMVYPFDDSLNFEEASLIEPAANAYAAVDRADVYPGDNVVIIGPGPIGLLALQFAKLKLPKTLIMVGTRKERLNSASRLSATHIINVHETDPYKSIMDITNGYGVDVVVLCAGTKEAWDLSGKILSNYGRVAVEALPSVHNTQWSVPVFNFTSKAISYIGVCGYTASQFEIALKLVESKKIDVSSLITHRFRLEDYEKAFETSDKHKDEAIKVVFEI